MRTSIETSALANKLDESTVLQMIRDAGFDCIDYSFYWLDEARNALILGDSYREHAAWVRAELDRLGLACNQAHAPFEFSMKNDTLELSNKNFRELVHSLEAASILGADSIIVHAIRPVDGESKLEANVRFYKSLEPFAREYGIHIALENLFGGAFDGELHSYTDNLFERPEKMRELAAALDSDVFVCCVDVGHSTITGIAPEEYIRGLDGKFLRALHIQDNRLTQDDHALPYTGRINWNAVTDALAEIGYEGDLTLEIFAFIGRFPVEVYPALLQLASAVARHLADMIEKKKAAK